MDVSDWMLDTTIFQLLITAYHFDKAKTVDMFATIRNKQTPMYCDVDVNNPDPNCRAHDVFSADWTKFEYCYANPPWTLLEQFKQHLPSCASQEILLIIPRSALFGDLQFIQFCIDHPILLPTSKSLFLPPDQQPNGQGVGTTTPAVAVLVSADQTKHTHYLSFGPPKVIPWPTFLKSLPLLQNQHRLAQLTLPDIATLPDVASARSNWPFTHSYTLDSEAVYHILNLQETDNRTTSLAQAIHKYGDCLYPILADESSYITPQPQHAESHFQSITELLTADPATEITQFLSTSHDTSPILVALTDHEPSLIPWQLRDQSIPLPTHPMWTKATINNWWIPVIVDTGAVASIVSSAYTDIVFSSKQTHSQHRAFGPVGDQTVQSQAYTDQPVQLRGPNGNWHFSVRLNILQQKKPLLILGLDVLRPLGIQIMFNHNGESNLYSAWQPDILIPISTTATISVSEAFVFTQHTHLGDMYREAAQSAKSNERLEVVTTFHFSGLVIPDTTRVHAIMPTNDIVDISTDQLKQLTQRFNIDWTLKLPVDHPFEQRLRTHLDVNLANSKIALLVFVQIMRHFHNAFVFDGHEIGSCSLIPFKINLRAKLPPIPPARRYSPAQRQALCEEKTKMYALSRWEDAPASATYASYPVVVTYPDKPPRIAVDYRVLNEYSEPDAYPFPSVESELRWLATDFKFISVGDAVKGFYQIVISDEDTRNYLAIRLPDETVRPTHMPYGHKNSPQHFVRVMNQVLGDARNKNLSAFVDDVHAKGKTMFDALSGIADWLNRFTQANLYMRLDKCHWLYGQFTALGFLITADGLLPDPAKVEVIQKWPFPETIDNLWSFWGLIGFYAGLIKDFSTKFAPLHQPIVTALQKFQQMRKQPTKQSTTQPLSVATSHQSAQHLVTPTKRDKQPVANLPRFIDFSPDPVESKKHDSALRRFLQKQPVVKTPELERVFAAAKDAISSAPVVASPRDGYPYVLLIDSSYSGMGLALEQVYPDGIRRAVAFYSRKLQPAEQNFAPVELECAGLIWALNKVKAFVDGATLTVITDHQALLWIHNYRGANSKLQRWASELSYWRDRMHIIHRPGRFHIVADALSRVAFLFAFECADPLFTAIAKALHTDNEPLEQGIQTVLNRLRTDPTSVTNYRLANGLLLYHKPLPNIKSSNIWVHYVPPTCRILVLQTYHDKVGHPGFARMITTLAESFWWPNMRTMVRNYAQACVTCQEVKSRSTPLLGELHPLPIPLGRWQSISMDFVGPFPTSTTGFDSIWVIVDQFTKAVHLYPVEISLNAATLADIFIKRYFPIHGIPHHISSDRDPLFTSHLWQSICKQLGCSHRTSTSHHQQADGQSERMIRTIVTILRSYVDARHNDWDHWLPVVEYSMNAFPHTGTKFSPYYVWQGFTPQFQWPDSARDKKLRSADADNFVTTLKHIHDEVVTNLTKYRDNMKLGYDSKRISHTFAVGDKVLLDTRPLARRHDKLDKRFIISTVKRVLEDDNYELELPMALRRCYPIFHVSKLRQFHSPLEGQSDYSKPGPIETNEPEEYEVQDIIDHRINRGKLQYLVLWKGWPRSDATWEPEDHLAQAQEILTKYQESTKAFSFTYFLHDSP